MVIKNIAFEIDPNGDCMDCKAEYAGICCAFMSTVKRSYTPKNGSIRQQCHLCKEYLSSEQPANPTTRTKAIAGKQYTICGNQYTAENTIEGCLGCVFEKAESCGEAPLCSGADFSVRFREVTE